MWVDGIEIEKNETVSKYFTVNDEYIFFTNEKGNVLFSFRLKDNEKNINDDINIVAEKTILRYDIIKQIQGE